MPFQMGKGINSNVNEIENRSDNKREQLHVKAVNKNLFLLRVTNYFNDHMIIIESS